MAITFIDAVGQDVTGAGEDITLPTLLENDVVMIGGANDFAGVGIPPNTADYQEVYLPASNAPGTGLWLKRMGPTPDTVVNVDDWGSGHTAFLVMCFRGVDPDQPLDVAIQSASGATGSPNAPAITPVTDGAAVVPWGFLDDDAISSCSLAGYDNVNFQATGASPLASVMAGWLEIETAAEEDPPAFVTDGDDGWNAVSVVLRPAVPSSDGVAAGTSTATGISASVGTANGSSTVAGVRGGVSEGTAAGAGVATGVAASVGVSAGVGTATGVNGGVIVASPAIGAKVLLVAAGVGSGTPTAEWSVHVSKMPAEPHRAIAIFDTGGAANPSPKWLLDEKTIQVRVRGNVSDYTVAYQKITDVVDVLLGLPAQSVEGNRWDGVTAVGDVTFIGRDDNDRPELVMNFRIIIERPGSLLTNREALE